MIVIYSIIFKYQNPVYFHVSIQKDVHYVSDDVTLHFINKGDVAHV